MRSLAVIFVLLLAGCGIFGSTNKDETAGWSANKLYAAAKDAMAQGTYDKAIKYYETLESRYPYGLYAQQAQIEIAYAYYKSDEPESAVAACDRFIKLHPDHPNVDYVYYLKGLANFNGDLGLLGYISDQDVSERDPKAMADSFAALKQLVTKFPNSKYTPDARLRMEFLVNALSSHEVHIADYYYRRGAYLAAVDRAQYALKNYPRTPATEEALFIMVKSYDALGMTKLRDDTDRIMHLNFPHSAYYTRGLAKKEPWWKLW